MTQREAYIKMRNSKSYDYNLFFVIYRESGGYLNNQMQFIQMFSQIDGNSIIEGLDIKFELTSLYGINGEFIRVVE